MFSKRSRFSTPATSMRFCMLSVRRFSGSRYSCDRPFLTSDKCVSICLMRSWYNCSRKMVNCCSKSPARRKINHIVKAFSRRINIKFGLPMYLTKPAVRRSHSFSSSSDESESGSSASLESAFGSLLEPECCDSAPDISSSPSLSFSLFIDGIFAEFLPKNSTVQLTRSPQTN